MHRLVIAVSAIVIALMSTAGARVAIAATYYAPEMPLAPRSLLLDLSAAGERILVAGEYGHILYSDDRGENWQQSRVPTTQMLTGIHFVDDKKGWAVGHDGLILVSDDGGANWRVQRDGLAAQQQTNLEQRELAYSEVGRLETALAEATGDERAELELQLEDAQLDLEDADLALEEGVFTSPLMDVWFLNEDRGWAVGAFGAFLETRNGGQTWINADRQIGNPDEFHLNAITGDSRGRVFIAGEGGIMFRSLDGGENWETLEPFYEGSWFGTLYSAHKDSLLIYGLRGNLYRSGDFGESWEPVASDNNATLAGGDADAAGRVVLVGSVGTLLVSEDGGESFRVTRLEDRLSLVTALFAGDRLVLAGQGGIKLREVKELYE
jgi:photosystem II stability/assembly factor-like uncharacterized protein